MVKNLGQTHTLFHNLEGLRIVPLPKEYRKIGSSRSLGDVQLLDSLGPYTLVGIGGIDFLNPVQDEMWSF